MSFQFAPGCQFYPSDQQLLHYYLSSKNENLNGYDLIKELDLYEYEPFDLPENVGYDYGCGGKRKHWYCYTKIRGLKDSRRSTKDGFWRRRGKVRDVVGPAGDVVLGTRTRFVYYRKRSPRNYVRTDWVLYEYALLHHVKASFVVCRVFVKSRTGGRNSISENFALSCCGEESVSAVRHVGVQCDGVHAEDAADRRNVLFKNPVSSELDKDQLLAIMEDDFIELDDLID